MDLAYHRRFFFLGQRVIDTNDAFLARPPNFTYTGASSSQLSAMTSVYTEGNTGAYSPFQRFALEAPVHSHLSTKEERASAFPGFPVLEGNRTLFPVSTLFSTCRKLLFGSHRARAVTPLPR